MKVSRSLFFLLSLSTILSASSDLNATKNTGFFHIDKELFISEDDGKFDVSKYLSSAYGFLPVPIIVTEPAVGYGGGLNLMFLHDSLASSLKRKSPPSISGVVVAGTENGTRFGGAYHLGFWKEDTIRTTTAAGTLDLNMNFYDVMKKMSA